MRSAGLVSSGSSVNPRSDSVKVRSNLTTCQLRRKICGNRAIRLCRASDAGVTLETVFASDSGATQSSTTKKEEEHYGGKE